MPYEVVFNTVSDVPVFSKFVIKDFEKERTVIDSKGKTVTLKLPKGTKVGSAIPIFTVSAKAPEFVVTVDGKVQESGVSVQNLSSPKNYTITTSYGASVTYKVSVEFVDTDVVPDKGGPSSGSPSRNSFGTVDTGQAGPELVPIAEPERFTDITGQADWAKQAIYDLADRGIINGVTESTFCAYGGGHQGAVCENDFTRP